MQAISQEELQVFCSSHPEWQHTGGKLVRTLRFPDFVQAMEFVNEVARLAELRGHHPDIDIRYNTVALGLVTHDAGGITERDLSLAVELSALKSA